MTHTCTHDMVSLIYKQQMDIDKTKWHPIEDQYGIGLRELTAMLRPVWLSLLGWLVLITTIYVYN